MNKKSQINSSILYGFIGVVALILVIGVVLSVSFKAQSNIRTTIAENKVASVTNETLTFTNGSAIALAQRSLSVVSGSEVVWGVGTEGSTYKQLNAGRNYTINYDGATITPINETINGWYNGSVFNVSYSYYYGSSERNITVKGQEGIKTLSDFQPTFGVVIAAIMVLGLLVSLIITFMNKMG